MGCKKAETAQLISTGWWFDLWQLDWGQWIKIEVCEVG